VNADLTAEFILFFFFFESANDLRFEGSRRASIYIDGIPVGTGSSWIRFRRADFFRGAPRGQRRGARGARAEGFGKTSEDDVTLAAGKKAPPNIIALYSSTYV